MLFCMQVQYSLFIITFLGHWRYSAINEQHCIETELPYFFGYKMGVSPL